MRPAEEGYELKYPGWGAKAPSREEKIKRGEFPLIDCDFTVDQWIRTRRIQGERNETFVSFSRLVTEQMPASSIPFQVSNSLMRCVADASIMRQRRNLRLCVRCLPPSHLIRGLRPLRVDFSFVEVLGCIRVNFCKHPAGLQAGQIP